MVFSISDRVRDMIISGGVNIYPIEIEACLAQTARGRRLCGLRYPDAEYGESIAAAIKLEPGVS